MENETTKTQDDGKLVAILSYIWPIGLILHYVGDRKTKLGAFHVRQATGLVILSVVMGILSMILVFMGIRFLSIVFTVANFGVFILWVIGLINAIKGEMKPLPLMGKKFDEILAAIK